MHSTHLTFVARSTVFFKPRQQLTRSATSCTYIRAGTCLRTRKPKQHTNGGTGEEHPTSGGICRSRLHIQDR